MNLFKSESDRYSQEQLSAQEAQRQAEFIAWGPIIFQISRLMLKFGVLDELRDGTEGLTIAELQQKTNLSEYALKILLEASLSAGTVLIDKKTEKYFISKTGWFLLNDPATRINIDFNHDVNYQGMFYLEEALREGKPAGLKTLGDWPTIYEGLSQLDPQVQKSWFGFDHFYSDHSFDKALEVVFGKKDDAQGANSQSSAKHVKYLMDVGGNTGRFALRCVDYGKDVNVTIVDLPGQIRMMRKNIEGKEGAERIFSFATNILETYNLFPSVADVLKNTHIGGAGSATPESDGWDAIWMSQFLDCFSEDEIYSILVRVSQVMLPCTTLYIMETFWNRQKYETASLCLTMTSVYFTAMANGNSKMYHSDELIQLVNRAGLHVVAIHDGIGHGHTILEVRKQ